eukprot:NODE_476_length_7980_cov_0.328258.p7 type:complete len:145 gc:universal NODE_476_length_7980_cov_0.328258:2764-3198(+)
MILEIPYDIAAYMTQFLNERDLISFSVVTKQANFHELALVRLKFQLKQLTLMSITSTVTEGRQTLMNNVWRLKSRIGDSFLYEVTDTPIVTHFDSSYLMKSYDKHTTVWFGGSRHSINDVGITVSKQENQIEIHYDLILTAIGQ